MACGDRVSALRQSGKWVVARVACEERKLRQRVTVQLDDLVAQPVTAAVVSEEMGGGWEEDARKMGGGATRWCVSEHWLESRTDVERLGG